MSSLKRKYKGLNFNKSQSLLKCSYGDISDRKFKLPLKIGFFTTSYLKNRKTIYKKNSICEAQFPEDVYDVIKKIRNFYDSNSNNQNTLIVLLDGNTSCTYKSERKYSNLLQYVENLLNLIDCPLIFYAALADNEYRLPRLGIINEILNNDINIESDKNNCSFPIDLNSSFVVGLPASFYFDNIKLIHFSINLGIKYYDIEDYLNGDPVPITERPGAFDPQTYLQNINDSSDVNLRLNKFIDKIDSTIKDNNIIVLLCGRPASGKSTLTKNRFIPRNYIHVNQDKLKTITKCLELTKNELTSTNSQIEINGSYKQIKKNKKIIVDNTNPDKETRKKWIDLASELNAKVWLIHLDTNLEVAKHNDAVRAFGSRKILLDPVKLKESNTNEDTIITKTKPIQPLPFFAFRSFDLRFQTPTLDEGFQDILDLSFRIEGTESEIAKWKMHWH